MPGHSPWFLGLLASRGRQVKVVDTAAVLVPERYRAADYQARLGKILLFGDGEWGLACQAVEEVIMLEHERVRWRGEGNRQPWLTGTVVDHMCALLDADEFTKLLSSNKLGTTV